MHTAFITHPDCREHDAGPWHPEAPGRLAAIEDHLIATGIDALLRHYEAPEVTREQLLRVHDAEYLDSLDARSPDHGLTHIDPDTAMNPYTLAAARRAAGALVQATELVLAGTVRNAFCCVRPPGHHAERRRAMGFCFYNNVAVGAAHALAGGGVQRVAIVDFDVHHGNGTQHCFERDADLFFGSSHQSPFYPGTGARAESGTADNIVNIPLARGADSATFRRHMRDDLLPALRRFGPLAMLAAGFAAGLLPSWGGRTSWFPTSPATRSPTSSSSTPSTGCRSGSRASASTLRSPGAPARATSSAPGRSTDNRPR